MAQNNYSTNSSSNSNDKQKRPRLEIIGQTNNYAQFPCLDTELGLHHLLGKLKKNSILKNRMVTWKDLLQEAKFACLASQFKTVRPSSNAAGYLLSGANLYPTATTITSHNLAILLQKVSFATESLLPLTNPPPWNCNITGNFLLNLLVGGEYPP